MTTQLPVFIEPAQLNDVLEDADIQVVAVADAAAHAQARIPGALQLQLADIVAAQPPIVGLLPPGDMLAQALAAAGLRDDAHIVAYDHGGGTEAARLLYTLLAAGHDAVSLLDGGINAWLADGFELDGGMSDAPAAGHFDIHWQDGRIADHDWITAHLDDGNTRIVDVRSAAEYAGADVRSARGGHVPGAIHLDWREFLQADGRLKPEAELQAIVAAHGITPGNDSVMYCQSHMRSSFTFLVLRLLGHDKVRGYPGAWSDWGNRSDTAVETGSP